MQPIRSEVKNQPKYLDQSKKQKRTEMRNNGDERTKRHIYKQQCHGRKEKQNRKMRQSPKKVTKQARHPTDQKNKN